MADDLNDGNPPPQTSGNRLMQVGQYLKVDLNTYDEDASVVANAMGAALLVGCIVATVGAWGHALSALLWAGACSAVGWAVGFLFGIPRSLASDDTSRTTQTAGAAAPAGGAAVVAVAPGGGGGVEAVGQSATVRTRPNVGVNTNLEQISDWLTKIIVGVTLVQLPQALVQLDQSAVLIAGSLGPGDTMKSFAYALMLYFSVTGFLGSYLLTRLFLQKAFEKANA